MTDQQYEKHQKLLSIKGIERRIKNLDEQIYELTESQYSPRAQQLKSDGGSGSGNTERDLSDYIVALEKLNSRLVREKTELVRRRCEIIEAISKLKDADEAAITEEFYLLRWPVSKISDSRNYSRRQVFRIRNEALDNIEI
ncbi:MAG: DUF1492 domain-containing protein [Oscillospiraceae bacterium]|nr:DUF1492 domain-containing protein [Oscillospiraceae bacterium]